LKSWIMKRSSAHEMRSASALDSTISARRKYFLVS
jgi:hypothetical protein